VKNSYKGKEMQILNLEKGIFFQMGKGQNWRVIHPDMGAKQITLNHGLHEPGNEFTQHTHDETEDLIVSLEGGGSMRQGHIYTPFKAGDALFVPANEVHGTKNTTDKIARVMSFQSPPDMALYRGERDVKEIPKPKEGHTSGIQIITMDKAGPVFGKPGDWRNIVSNTKGAKHLSMDYIKLNPGDEFQHKPIKMEGIYVLIVGIAEMYAKNEHFNLKSKDVIFLNPSDTFNLKNIGAGPTKLVYCWAI
jgi:mannose-6-phosphate isomerase-like protein (cupin superfamily)